MVSTYVLLKWVHVLAAIIAVGFNASYSVLLARAAREPQHLGHVLRTVKALDDYFANPMYGLLLATGLGMAYLTDWSLLGAFWLRAALVLYVLLAVVGIAVYSPTLRRQIRELDARGAASPEFQRLSTRGTVVGIALAAVVTVIVFLMVVKPASPL